MEFCNKKYYIAGYRIVLFGLSLLLIGSFFIFMLFQPIYEKDISSLFLVIVGAILSITATFYGFKTILNFRKFIQLEICENEVKYLIIGKGRGAALNFFIGQSFESVKYSNIRFAQIKTEYYHTFIQLIQNDDSQVNIYLLYEREKELVEMVTEIRKRLK